jgi:hypothetical protein
VKVDHFPVEKLLAGKFASVSLELSDHRYPQNPIAAASKVDAPPFGSGIGETQAQALDMGLSGC